MKVLFDDARHEFRRHPATAARRQRVLLVEDDPGICAIVRRFLEADGHEVIAVDAPQDALAILEEPNRRFDLLVTDVIMPGMNGFQLAELVRERHLGVNVLYITGYLDDTIARCGIDRRECAVLQKPFGRRALRAAIRETLCV